MGFLKKLGKGLKKGAGGLIKMASVKNIVKAASGQYKDLGKEALGRLQKGVVGSVTAEFTKKSTAKNAVPTGDNMEIKTKNPSLKDLGLSALGGALTSAGMTLTDNKDVAEQMANASDNVAMAWFKKNWLKLLGVLVVGTLVVWGLIKLFRGKKRKSGRAF